MLPSALFQGVKSRAVKELSENSRYLLFHDARAVIFYYNAIVVFVYLVNLNKNIRKYAALFAGIELYDGANVPSRWRLPGRGNPVAV